MLIIVRPSYPFLDELDIVSIASTHSEGRHATGTRDSLKVQMMQTIQTLPNPTLLGLEFPESFRGLGATELRSD